MKATPSLTKWFNVGVLTYGLPSAPIVSNLCWSVQYQRILGLESIAILRSKGYLFLWFKKHRMFLRINLSVWSNDMNFAILVPSIGSTSTNVMIDNIRGWACQHLDKGRELSHR